MDIRRIEPNEIDAVLEVFADSFFDDQYYKGAYSDKQAMMDDFREVMTWTLENGWNMGSYENGYLIGMALTFPLRKLDDRMFGEFFGSEGVLHDTMRNSLDANFLFAMCVDEAHRGKGVANALFDSVLDEGVAYIGDTTSVMSRRMCEKRGFKTERFSETDDWWYKVYRPALVEQETMAL